MRVLMVEGRSGTCKLLGSHLTKHGFVVDAVASWEVAKSSMSAINYDAMLIDLLPPAGHWVCRLEQMRREERATGIIIIMPLGGSLHDRIELLEAGADDCIVSPFDFDELVSRMRAIARRCGRSDKEPLSFADVIFYPERLDMIVNGRSVILRPHAARLIATLLSRAGEPVSRDRLMTSVYEQIDEINSNALAVHIHHLRKKLAAAGARVKINAVRNGGYLLQEWSN
jgi:DNA-binding response OmpR family regulator